MSCIATSSTVKDDVSALLWVLGFHPSKVLRISTAQEESDINSTSTQKYKNTCLLRFCVESNSKTFPAGRYSIQFFMLLFSNYLPFFSVVGSPSIKTDNNKFLEQKYQPIIISFRILQCVYCCSFSYLTCMSYS